MTRTIRLALAAALVVACADHDPTHPLLPEGPDRAISDGITDGNPHFFFLPPMVEQPSAGLLTGFEPAANPVVRIVCEDSNQGGCDGFEPIVFAVGDGVLVESDHYKVEFDTKAYDGLQTSGGGDFTTYRIRVEVSLDIEALGSFTFGLGHADIQLAENGKEAKNITAGTEQVIALVDGRTLPIRFRIDRGALELELKAATAALEDEGVCQINCSVTFVDPAEETLAALADPDFGGALATAMLFRKGDVIVPSVLIIDERVAEGEDANCAPGLSLQKKNCYRYTIEPKEVPDVDHRFADHVRFGICPVGVPTGQGTQWGLFRVSGDLVERPPETRVDDFLPCDHAFQQLGWVGVANRLAQAAFDWLVPPLYAGDCGDGTHDCWGGTLRDISDLLWAEDAEMTLVSDAEPEPADAGTEIAVTVRVMGVHSAPATPLEGVEVDFAIGPGFGELVSVPGFDSEPINGVMRVLTDADGVATVGLIPSAGTNHVTVSSTEAMGGPFEITATGLGLVSHWTADATMPNAYGDVVGQNHGVVVTGAVPLVPGVEGGAFEFTGDGSVISAPAAGWGDAKQLTAALWAWLDPAGSPIQSQRFITMVPAEKLILRQDGHGDGRTLGFVMGFGEPDPDAGFIREILVEDTLTAGCWHHVAGSYDGQTMRVFLDGALVGDLVVDDTLRELSVTADHMFLSSPELGEALTGLLDDIRVYNKALDAAEIAALAAGGPECDVVAVDGLVHYSGDGLGGVMVELVQAAEGGGLGDVLQTTTTGADGRYGFDGVLDGDYHVRAYGPTEEFIAWKARSFSVAGEPVTVDLDLPKVIALLSPADGSHVAEFSPTLQWTANTEAATYTVQINRTGDGALVEHAQGVPTNSHVVTAELQVAESYTWQVDATDAAGHHVGTTANAFNFTVVPAVITFEQYPDGSAVADGPLPADASTAFAAWGVHFSFVQFTTGAANTPTLCDWSHWAPNDGAVHHAVTFHSSTNCDPGTIQTGTLTAEFPSLPDSVQFKFYRNQAAVYALAAFDEGGNELTVLESGETLYTSQNGSPFKVTTVTVTRPAADRRIARITLRSDSGLDGSQGILFLDDLIIRPTPQP